MGVSRSVVAAGARWDANPHGLRAERRIRYIGSFLGGAVLANPSTYRLPCWASPKIDHLA